MSTPTTEHDTTAAAEVERLEAAAARTPEERAELARNLVWQRA